MTTTAPAVRSTSASGGASRSSAGASPFASMLDDALSTDRSAGRGPSDPNPACPNPRRAPNPQALRKLLLRLHFYAGVFVGPFLLVAALTGFIYAFAPTLEKLASGSYLEAPATDSPLPASEQLQAALDGRDPSTVLSLQTAEAGGSTRVVFADPSVGLGETTVFVDPGSGKVLGALATDSGDLPLRTWLGSSTEPAPGRNRQPLQRTGRIVAWVIALGGVYLW